MACSTPPPGRRSTVHTTNPICMLRLSNSKKSEKSSARIRLILPRAVREHGCCSCEHQERCLDCSTSLQRRKTYPKRTPQHLVIKHIDGRSFRSQRGLQNSRMLRKVAQHTNIWRWVSYNGYCNGKQRTRGGLFDREERKTLLSRSLDADKRTKSMSPEPTDRLAFSSIVRPDTRPKRNQS